MLARFVPVIRTFTPIVAGISRMHYRTFLTYNIVGATLWGTGVTVLGYFLGQIAVVKNNIDLILVGIVAISLLPIAVEILRSRHRRRGNITASIEPDDPPSQQHRDPSEPGTAIRRPSN